MTGNFKFHNVGQGLFYSGTITNGTNNFNFVYDCGQINKGDINVNVREQIDALADDIDMLVISHLHEDHISEIPYLLNSKNVRKLYLPYFDTRTYNDVFIASLLSDGMYENEALFDFALRLYSHNNDYDIELIKSNTIQLVNNNGWWFEFYNNHLEEDKLIRLQQSLNELTNGQSILDWFRRTGNINPIKSIFSAELYGRDHNISSLVLMHYKEGSIKTLLTGDVPANDDLNKRLEHYLKSNDKIILQIPHHGSEMSYSHFSNICKDLTLNAVISYGINNIYNHPTATVVNDLIKRNITITRVNQHSTFEYTL